jgi:hypothetical protein
MTRRTAGESFTVSRRVVVPDGDALEYAMATAPLEQLSIARGGTNWSATLSGYVDPETWGAETRALSEVQTLTIDGARVRVRCKIDWALRPTHTAQAAGQSFTVDYISYYVGPFGAYMDVGG